MLSWSYRGEEMEAIGRHEAGPEGFLGTVRQEDSAAMLAKCNVGVGRDLRPEAPRFQAVGISLLQQRTVKQLYAFVVQVLLVHVETAVLSHRRHPATHAAPDSQKLNQEILSSIPDRPEQGLFLPLPVYNTSP